ncbi:MAG: metallophosphoesterase family protein [Longimicrobiales bacterium]
MRRALCSILLIALTGPLAAQDLKLPLKDGSVKLAVLGDTGTGGSDQVAVARMVTAYRAKFPFEFALLLGDNLYGSERPGDYARKFEQPYKVLLTAGVKFYAALGNHDDPSQVNYKQFNMNGERYYSFKPSLTAGVRLFALDSNYMDPKQLEWLEKELAASGSDWKIAFFHHPPYASGRHGSDEILRSHLEPLFVKHAVNVVFTGHEHFYERIKPQKGVQYFVSGSSAKLRRGDIDRTGLTAFGYDQGFTFMLVEIVGDEMFFQAITERGQTIDSGMVRKGSDNRVIGTAGRTDNSKPQRPSSK